MFLGIHIMLRHAPIVWGICVFFLTIAFTSASYALPNPVQSVNSARDFDAVGVTLDIPLEAEDVVYAIIAQRVAEIRFSMQSHAYVVRAAKGNEDFSGVYGLAKSKPELFTLTCGKSTVVAAQQSAADGRRLALWHWNGQSFSLYAQQAVNAETFEAILLQLARVLCEEGAH